MPDGLLVGEDRKLLVWGMGEYIYAVADLPLAARVLEVGSGQNPHAGADVVVDKFIHDNYHRPGHTDFVPERRVKKVDAQGREQEEVRVPVEVIEADVIDMPFADKEFDYVIARDVLEHVPDIAKAFAEISRVGKAGIIDVPRFYSEWLWPQGEMHKYVFSDGPDGGIVARPIAFTSPFGNVMHDIFPQLPPLREAWCQSRSILHLVRQWEGDVSVTVGEPITNPPLLTWAELYANLGGRIAA